MEEIEIPSNTWHYITLKSKNFPSTTNETIHYETGILSDLKTEPIDVYKVFLTNKVIQKQTSSL